MLQSKSVGLSCLHGSIHLFNKNKCNTRYSAPSSGNLESQWNTCLNLRENPELSFEENLGLPPKFPLGYYHRKVNVYHPPNYLFSKSTKITLKIGVFDTISQCVAHRALWQEKRISWSNMFAKQRTVLEIATYISFVKASRWKHFLLPQNSFFENTYQYPMELLASAEMLTMIPKPDCWLSHSIWIPFNTDPLVSHQSCWIRFCEAQEQFKKLPV